MRAVLDLAPRSAASRNIMAEWAAAWGEEAMDGEADLDLSRLLPALLDLRTRCYGKAVVLNVFFPDCRQNDE